MEKMNYTFTIGIIVCDKDIKFLKSLISNINENVKGNYYIVVYNNCVEKYNYTMNFNNKNVIILPNTYKHKNARQLYARKMIVEEAYILNTDYVWFIDADDEVLAVDINNIDFYTDIVVFPYNSEGSKNYMPTNLLPGQKIASLSYEVFLDIGTPLWMKFIRTSILKKSYDLIDAYNLPPISCSEDTIISLLILKFAKTYSKHHETIYFNHRMRGDSNNPKVHIENVKNFSIGINEFFKLTDSLFDIKEQSLLNIPQIRISTIDWILSRICLIEDPNEVNESMDFINSIIDDKYKDEYNTSNNC